MHGVEISVHWTMSSYFHSDENQYFKKPFLWLHFTQLVIQIHLHNLTHFMKLYACFLHYIKNYVSPNFDEFDQSF